MFLSDELLEIGRKSNPKNNLSMFEAGEKMKALCNQRLKDKKSMAEALQIRSSFNFAAKTLFKEGYTFFDNLHTTLEIINQSKQTKV